jgi:hypothetical protein
VLHAVAFGRSLTGTFAKFDQGATPTVAKLQ